jgi:hypothetical protein
VTEVGAIVEEIGNLDFSEKPRVTVERLIALLKELTRAVFVDERAPRVVELLGIEHCVMSLLDTVPFRQYAEAEEDVEWLLDRWHATGEWLSAQSEVDAKSLRDRLSESALILAIDRVRLLLPPE